MNKRRAKKLLKEQIEKVDDLNHSNFKNWVNTTKNYMIRIFNNQEYIKEIDDLSLININASIPGVPFTTLEELKNNIKEVINRYIVIVDLDGVYKKQKKNILSDKSNYELLLVGLGILVFGVTIGAKLSKLIIPFI